MYINVYEPSILVEYSHVALTSDNTILYNSKNVIYEPEVGRFNNAPGFSPWRMWPNHSAFHGFCLSRKYFDPFPRRTASLGLSIIITFVSVTVSLHVLDGLLSIDS